MSRDMLSGPDLGAGYLHQLSIDREEETSFTYHAQEGGLDANGPPKGPLAPIGFVHPATACQFGGRRCWHRRFVLPAVESARVRATYNRHRFVLQTTLDQLYGDAPFPIETALGEVLDRIGRPLADEGIPFYLRGAAGAWVHGVPERPHELELGTTDSGVIRIGELLRDYLIEPVAPTDWPGVARVVGGRAFVGSLNSGMRVAWAVPHSEEPESTLAGGADDDWRRLAPLELVEWSGRSVSASRLEFALARAASHNQWERLKQIGERVKSTGPNQVLLRRLITEAKLGELARNRIREALGTG
jgi:hypothetical protein